MSGQPINHNYVLELEQCRLILNDPSSRLAKPNWFITQPVHKDCTLKRHTVLKSLNKIQKLQSNIYPYERKFGRKRTCTKCLKCLLYDYVGLELPDRRFTSEGLFSVQEALQERYLDILRRTLDLVFTKIFGNCYLEFMTSRECSVLLESFVGNSSPTVRKPAGITQISY
jgi:hypothetical protein